VEHSVDSTAGDEGKVLSRAQTVTSVYQNPYYSARTLGILK